MQSVAKQYCFQFGFLFGFLVEGLGFGYKCYVCFIHVCAFDKPTLVSTILFSEDRKGE